MKLLKEFSKNYLCLLLAIILAGIIFLSACKPEVPLGAPSRGFIWNPKHGLELWAENSSGGGIRVFYIDTNGRIQGATLYSPNITSDTGNANFTAIDVDYYTGPIGRGATFSIAASNSTAAEIRQADYYASNSTNLLTRWNSVMSALPIRGGLVQLFTGNYTSSNNLTLSVPGTTVRGSGYNTVASVNESSAVFYVTANNTIFENMRIDKGGIVVRAGVNSPTYRNVKIGDIKGFSNFQGIASGSANMTVGLPYIQVLHGLGTAPIHVFLTYESQPEAPLTIPGVLWWASANATASAFQILSSQNATITTTVGWIAITNNP